MDGIPPEKNKNFANGKICRVARSIFFLIISGRIVLAMIRLRCSSGRIRQQIDQEEGYQRPRERSSQPSDKDFLISCSLRSNIISLPSQMAWFLTVYVTKLVDYQNRVVKTSSMPYKKAGERLIGKL